ELANLKLSILGEVNDDREYYMSRLTDRQQFGMLWELANLKLSILGEVNDDREYYMSRLTDRQQFGML
ncbi:hypothetical protein, partial [Chryseobacterium sp. CH1]|uniref:hypothetical protein n=1 Tax=Chryseobacterium sp. CH1 TaxID=713551 RepID=UPI001025926A